MVATAADLEAVPWRGLRGSHRRAWSWAVFAIALAMTMVSYRELWANPSQRALGSAYHSNDPMQMMWFLKWVPWALLHGHNPLYTHAILYPEGVSLTWNTFVPTLAIIAAPVTLSLGASVSFALLITLGPPLTAVTGFWWLRRHTRQPAPAAVGALLLAFNPFVAGHMLGHLNLVFLTLVPLTLMLGEDLLWRHPRPTVRTAIYLGLVAGLQLGISEEALLLVVVETVLGLAVAAVVMWRETVAVLVTSWRGIAVAVGTFLVITAPLLVSQLFLSRSATVATRRFRAIPDDYLYPLQRQVLVPPGRQHRSYLGGAEDGVYLGWLVIAILVIGVALTLRDRRVRIATVLLVISVLLTFGTNGIAGVWLPWRLFAQQPIFESVLPARFALGSFLVIAWLIATWLDRLVTASLARRAAGIAVVVALVVTFLPRPVPTTRLPARVAFLGSATQRALLPDGSPILLLPAPWTGDASGMYLQQRNDFRFAVPTGYALMGDTGRDARAQVLRRFLATSHVGGERDGGPAVSVADARLALHALRLRAIVVVLSAPAADRSLAVATALAQRPPDLTTGGVALWKLLPVVTR
jgi:hypothetical protein